MVTIYRPPICTNLIVIAVALYLLLGAVMVRLAKRLPVVPIPKQFKVAFVFVDVVYYRCGCCAVLCQTHNAQWMLLKVCQASFLRR